VKTGIRVAAGDRLPFTQKDIVLRGHAIECRINAEDATRRFLPHPGRIVTYREPSGPGVRVDSGVVAGSEISPNYDPLIAKLIVWDSDRAAATQRMLRALGEFEITGLRTLIPFHRRLLATEQWEHGETCRDLLEDDAWLASTGGEQASAGDGDVAEQRVMLDYTVEVSGRRFDVRVSGSPSGPAGNPGPASAAARPRQARSERTSSAAAGGDDVLRSPMQGTVLKIAVETGAKVEPGALIAVVEAMKMENEITAHKAGTVSSLPISVGSSVASGDTLAVIESA
jgi:acetyl-CoA/propionyl-CoA carboxylase biotin carboxyl carrier protein